MVWTLIGASPPTGTEPTMICRDLRRSISRHGRMEDIAAHIGREGPAAKPVSPIQHMVATLIALCVPLTLLTQGDKSRDHVLDRAHRLCRPPLRPYVAAT